MTVEIVGWALVHSLWQGAVIAVLLGLTLRALRKAPAAWRHWLCFVALLALVILPVLTSVRTLDRQAALPPSQQAAISGAVPQNVQPTVERSPTIKQQAELPPPAPRAPRTADIDIARWLPWLVALWSLGVLLLSLRVIGGYVWARRLVHFDTTPASLAITEMAERLAQRLHVRAAVRVLESTRAQVPMVIGFVRPVVLLPVSLLTGLTPQQLEAILAHELAHVRRYDYALNVLQTIFETLLFYHPAMWWVSKRMRDEREQACDELAVAMCGGDPYFYSRVLIAVEEWRSARITFAPAVTGGSLATRIKKLIGEDDRRFDVGPRWFAGIVTIVALLSTVGGAAQDKLEAGTPEPQTQTQDPARARPASVNKYTGSAELAQRFDWAHDVAKEKKFERYWVGYVVTEEVNDGYWIFIDRNSPIRAGESWITGRMRFGSDFKNLKFSGVNLDSYVGDYSPRQHAVLLAFDGAPRKPRLIRVHMANFAFPVHFNGWPLIWLNETPGAASIALLANMQGHTNDEELLGDLPAAIGAHADTRTATPILARWATDTGSPLEFRRESVEALAQQDAPGVLAILAGIARRDPDETVRAEAVESIGEVSAAAAADTLLAFATSLASSHLRSEAVEALGDRTEPQVAGWLDQLARGNDSEVRGEALETLADLPAAAGLAKLTAIADDARLSSTLRLEAVEELGNLEAPKALETLRRIIFEEGDVSLQMKATETLGDLHGIATVEQLVKIAETHPQVVVQIEATETLSDMDEQEAAIRALNRLATSHPQVSVQVKAIETLGDFSNELATRSLMDYVMSENPEPLLIAAAEALGNVPPTTELLRFMERALTSGISEHVKIELVEALEDLGDAGRPLLRKMADSGSPSVRGKALEILTDN